MSALKLIGKATRPITSGLAGVILTGAVALCFWYGLLDTLELKAYDLRFQLRKQKAAHKDILLVTIDQTTVKDLGRKTTAISRADHAQLIKNLTSRGAKLIVFDMDFSSPSSSADAWTDFELQSALAETGNVIMSRYISQGDWVRPHEMFRSAQVMADDALRSWTRVGVPDEQGNLTVEWSTAEGAVVDGFAIFMAGATITDPYAESVMELGQAPPEDNQLVVSGLDPVMNYHFLVMAHKMVPLLAGEGAINVIEDKDDRIRRKPLVVGVELDTEKVP